MNVVVGCVEPFIFRTWGKGKCLLYLSLLPCGLGGNKSIYNAPLPYPVHVSVITTVLKNIQQKVEQNRKKDNADMGNIPAQCEKHENKFRRMKNNLY
ncbi:hypothetical protein COY95_00240 [Candidatus Woesearchaeota archaeon CG_4_10_14_0_8_um_filter_47_5]|nr:MAG: hypothetical protein COY95_00240 [Candidatus Woesearchaeota archaeon CG_4_10_14_0_8_um_filter_47_5]